MTTMVIGGTGFIGRRLVPLLVARGEEIVCMDINPGTASYDHLGKQVRVVRGDVSQFDDVMAAMATAKPARVVNLAYYLGSEHPPHVAFKLNILGMDNCFQPCRLEATVPPRSNRSSSTSSAWTIASRRHGCAASTASPMRAHWRSAASSTSMATAW